MSALGHKQTCAIHQPMSALPPIATAKADMPQMVMSALLPKADMCGANEHVRYGPIADISRYSITSSARDSSDGGIVIPSAFAVLLLMTNSNRVACRNGKSVGRAPFRIFTTCSAAFV